MKSTATSSTEATPPAAAGVSPAIKTGVQHDAARQARLLRDALESAKSRVGFFLGAGCPMGLYDEKGEKTLALIPDVANLTKSLRVSLEDGDKTLGTDEKHLPCWDALAKACQEGGGDEPNVEHILTELRTLTARRSKEPFSGLSKERMAALDARVCDLIVEAVGKTLPKHRGAYHQLASWIGGLSRAASVDVFTPNYDLLMEEAFEQQKIPHFDGFVGSREPFFDIASIEQDAVPRRWARLWKLHGSINWQRRDDGGVFRAQGKAKPGKAMIYPSHLKYDQSRRMPYLAMIDRLRAFFRNADQARGFTPPVLIICGYSFADDHLNEVLLDGLRGNPGTQCFTLVFGPLKDAARVVQAASERPNLTVLARDGAVVGTRSGLYAPHAPTALAHEPWLVTETKPAIGSTPETTITQCRLGDFHYLGLFLERLYGGRSEIEPLSTHA